jgi:hypothetical protein
LQSQKRGDRRHAAIDRPSPAATKWHLGFDAASGAYLDLVLLSA